MKNKESAIILSDGLLATPFGKTTHGLIKHSDRFEIVGVVDSQYAGQDAGQVAFNAPNGIPIFVSTKSALAQLPTRPKYCIIGVATEGGQITSTLKDELLIALKHNICVLNGLHELLSSNREFLPYSDLIHDIRRPKPYGELSFWTGEITQVKAPRIAVLGTHCAIGKRTTCQQLNQALNQNNIHSQMIYTGQTGCLQGSKYGFIFDSTLNDFVGGELEKSVVTCDRETQPDLILLEGQSSFFNPSGPCGSEFILCAGAKGVILQCAPKERYYLNEHFPVAPIENEIAMVKLLGAKVLAITLNTRGLTDDEMSDVKQTIAYTTHLPVLCPKEQGVSELIPIVSKFIQLENKG